MSGTSPPSDVVPSSDGGGTDADRPGDAAGGPEKGSASDSSPTQDSDSSPHFTGAEDQEGKFGEEGSEHDVIADAEEKLISEVMKESDESEEEQIAAERKAEMKTLKEIIANATQIQDATSPSVYKFPEKEAMKGSVQKSEDTNFMKSMQVAERGYINRLRPESTAERPTVSQYQIRPSLENKFKSLLVKEMIHSVLNDELGGKEYSEEEAKIWSQTIANIVRTRVKDMGFPRYKFVVQCVIGEEHGAGVKIGCRCLWDADTDSFASDTFLNETIFCMTAVYAVYFY